MAHGAVVVYAATMASAGTLTSEVDLGRNWEKVYVLIPTMTSNTAHFFKVAHVNSAAGGVYRRVVHPAVNSSTVSTLNDFTVGSATTNRAVPFPNGFRYVKIESEVTVNDGATYRIICSD